MSIGKTPRSRPLQTRSPLVCANANGPPQHSWSGRKKAPTKYNAWTWDRGEKDTVDTRIAYMHRIVENTLQRRNQLTGHVAFRVTTSNGKASNRQRIVDAAVETTRTIAYGIQAFDRLSGIIEALMV